MSRLHPAFDKRISEDYDLEDAVMYYPVGNGTVEILKIASSDIEARIKEIKSGNRKISIREMNKLNRQLYTVNKNIEEIIVRLEAFSVIFDNIDIGAAN
jgi:hypothetical protein